MKFRMGAAPASQCQKSKTGAETSRKKSRNTIKKAPVMTLTGKLLVSFEAMVPVIKVRTAQLTPISKGTPSILAPRLFP